MSNTFDDRSTRRISAAVQRVEGTPRDALPAARRRAPVLPVEGTFRLTDETRDGANWRWTYTGRLQEWTGGFGWSDVGGPVPLLNLAEADNGSTGSASGIDLSDDRIDGIKPITGRVNAALRWKADGTAVYVFCLPNAPDINC